MERTFKEAIKLNMLNELRVEEGETGKFILQDEVISINEKIVDFLSPAPFGHLEEQHQHHNHLV